MADPAEESAKVFFAPEVQRYTAVTSTAIPVSPRDSPRSQAASAQITALASFPPGIVPLENFYAVGAKASSRYQVGLAKLASAAGAWVCI